MLVVIYFWVVLFVYKWISGQNRMCRVVLMKTGCLTKNVNPYVLQRAKEP